MGITTTIIIMPSMSPQLSVFVAGEYVLEVHVLSYSNPTNRCEAFSGGCCDDRGPGADCNSGNHRCDTYFRFCLRPFNTLNTSRDCATTAVTSTAVLNDNFIDFTQPSFLGLANPLALSGLDHFLAGKTMVLPFLHCLVM